MPPIELEKDLADTLTPEELAAIKDEQYSPEELAAMKGIVGNDDDDEDGADDDGKATDAPAADAKAAAPAAADDAAATAGADTAAADPDADVPAEFKPVYQAQLPDDYGARLEAAQNAEASAWAKFDAGDIDRGELQAELRRLSGEREELAALKLKADIAGDMSKQTTEQEWNHTVSTFAAQVAKAGEIDYRKDTAKQRDLDSFVKALAADDANADKPMRWFLDEAHRRVKALHGMTDAPAAKPKPEDALAAARAARKPPLDAAPKTLAQVPGSDGPGDVSGEFSDLDALDGMDLEDAIAKMSPSQRDRYLRTAA